MSVNGIKQDLTVWVNKLQAAAERAGDQIDLPDFPGDLPDVPGFREIKKVYNDSLNLSNQIPSDNPAAPMVKAIPSLIPAALLTGFGLNMLLYGSVPMKLLGGAMAAAGIPMWKSFGEKVAGTFQGIADTIANATSGRR